MGKDLRGKELGKGLGQRKDGRYEARAVVNGQKIALYNFNLNELKREFEREKDKARRSNIITRQDITVSEWYEAWFDQYKKPTLKPNSVSAYKRRFANTYGSILETVNLKELNQFMIQTATTELINKGYKFRTIREALSIFKHMLDAAVGNCIIEANPALGIIVPTYAETKEDRRVLTKEEQRIFLDKVENSHYKELYHFMLLTGVRVGEMGALQWEDIDFKNEFININHSLACEYLDGNKKISITTPKTKNSFRKIPFFEGVKEILVSQKEKQEKLKKQLGNRWRNAEELGDANLVFTSSMGSPVTRYVLEHDMRQVSKEINTIELYNAAREGRQTVAFEYVHPHALRHTFATRCFEKGMSVEVVQKIMGHANINMTMSYTHVLEDVLKNEAKKVGNFLDV